ncbi:hypothetical protein AHMF7616_03044 [Adhaeribacter pallidiroseus]|uniref:Uncharacterized protein n=1 Tax=Adhaeribacter pallidiroseus TaxID=2072847 RepID=A0A369QJE8_9BACT|nr:hypothetical protein AHMF7616_03044 [Adhaeribacter pallidiroseus]
MRFNGVLDFLLVPLIHYYKSQDLYFLNLGLAPLLHLEQTPNIPEKKRCNLFLIVYTRFRMYTVCDFLKKKLPAPERINTWYIPTPWIKCKLRLF